MISLAALLVLVQTGSGAPPARVAKVAGGFTFLEGPVWTRRGTLIFSDVPANRMYELGRDGKVRVFRDPSNNANGNTLDPQGRLVTAEQATRRITRTEKDGKITVLADRYQGKRLNSPNDVVVRSNGDVYFTDPPYGLPPGTASEIGFAGVYRIRKGGRVELISRAFERPNGLAFSPDERRLYVDDTAAARIWVFPVRRDGSVGAGREFARLAPIDGKPNNADGMRVDRRGVVYATGAGGIQMFGPDGSLRGRIEVPQMASNCEFAGSDGKTLYVTATTGLYRVRLRANDRSTRVRATRTW